MFDWDELGKYQNAFSCVEDAINDMISEFTNSQLAKFEIKTKEDGSPDFDEKQFETILLNIALVDEKSEALKTLFYNGYRALAKKEAENEGPYKSGKEEV